MLNISKERMHDLWYIFRRNVFLLTNLIIALVVCALAYFGDKEAALFIGAILVVNMSLGLAQDIRAWAALERLELLTSPHSKRMNADGKEEMVLTDNIKAGDVIVLTSGDQIPCDGVLLSAAAFELSEGLITGESVSFTRKEGDKLLAGSIVTTGTGTMRATGVYGESRIARMTEGVKSYSVNQSPIQREVGKLVVSSGYLLLGVILIIVLRGISLHEDHVLLVKEVGALASGIVPQGLVFTMTLLFAYGAAHLFKRNVLLQEVNATEKLGHIKNLCMDKTGTLTENVLMVERIMTPPGVSTNIGKYATAAYLFGSGDTSQTVVAIGKFIATDYHGKMLSAQPFSSWRSYGAVKMAEGDAASVYVAGAPEHILPAVRSSAEHAWLAELIAHEAHDGKRVFCVAQVHSTEIPSDLAHTDLTPLAVFVFSAKLREGIREAVDFFQKRDVRIRIISGDHPETVRAIAASAGVLLSEKVITGGEIATWSAEDYLQRAKEYTVFARTLPEQKEKLITALKADGFTAMVGDGANDALAIKKADLGIAMWEGAPATRQIASVVLMNNSFTALPGGVELADSIIKNAEIFASIFFEFSFGSFFLFLVTLALGYPYPLSPLNITLINYFTVGIPGVLISYWTIRPPQKVVAPSDGGFLRRVLPFTILSALLQSVVIAAVFALSPLAMKTSGSNLSVVFTVILTGFIFFLFTPQVFRGTLSVIEKRTLLALAVFETVLLALVFQVPFLLRFFDVTEQFPPLSSLGIPILLIALFAAGEYGLAKWWGR